MLLAPVPLYHCPWPGHLLNLAQNNSIIISIRLLHGMVALETIQKSNDLISKTFSAGLVAVFVGATSGIGEYTLLEFARTAPEHSRVYFVGRSKEAGSRIKVECEKLNSQGTFEFIASDISLLKNVDEVCQQIKGKERYINILFQTQGKVGGSFGLYVGPISWQLLINISVTSEGLEIGAALAIFSRTRFMVNLLPLLNAAPSLRRVVTVAAGTTEGPVDPENLDLIDMSFLKSRAQRTSMVTLSIDALAKQNPTVSFIHNYPGAVQSGIYRDMKGLTGTPLRLTLNLLYRFYHISAEETGQRHMFLLTSARYPPKRGDEAKGVEVAKDVSVARGIDGVAGSGCYCASQPCDEGSTKNFALLKKLREDGMTDKVWEHIEKKFNEITGSVCV